MPDEIIQLPPLEIEITTPAKEVVEFKDPPKTIIEMQYTAPGPPGAPGLPGPQGDPGPPGVDGTDATYTHIQIQASTEWIINHNLGKKPSVTVVDSSGGVIVADIQYNTLNQITVRLNTLMSGEVYFN